jgi:hypothetical protein
MIVALPVSGSIEVTPAPGRTLPTTVPFNATARWLMCRLDPSTTTMARLVTLRA